MCHHTLDSTSHMWDDVPHVWDDVPHVWDDVSHLRVNTSDFVHFLTFESWLEGCLGI
jgi:hypothetical protein